MNDRKTTRRDLLKSVGALGVLGTVTTPGAVSADDDDEKGRVRWDLVLVGSGCVEPGGTASAFAQDDSKITLTGRGTFPNIQNQCSKKVTGGGTWKITSPMAIEPGCFAGSGRYVVVELLSWTPAPPQFPPGLGDCIGKPADARSGLAKLRIRYDNGAHGVLTVSCDLPGAGHLLCMFEGITASMEYEDFWRTEAPQPGVDGNRTIFHILRDEHDRKDR